MVEMLHAVNHPAGTVCVIIDSIGSLYEQLMVTMLHVVNHPAGTVCAIIDFIGSLYE